MSILDEPGQVPGFKRKVKDSVFTNLFSDRGRALELYRALHPEDTGTGVEDVEIVTVENVLADGLYNDLGMIVGGRLLVLVEAQSTWDPAIAVRSAFYCMRTLFEYIERNGMPIRGKVPALPRPEIYVIYTGRVEQVPASLSLYDAFGLRPPENDVFAVRVIGEPGDTIIGQYVAFCHVVDRCNGQLGRTREAAVKAVDECISRGILAPYLRQNRLEVVGIMMALFSQEEAVERYGAKREAQGIEKGLAQGIEKGLAQGRAEGTVAHAANMVEQLGVEVDRALDVVGVADSDRGAYRELVEAELAGRGWDMRQGDGSDGAMRN